MYGATYDRVRRPTRVRKPVKPGIGPLGHSQQVKNVLRQRRLQPKLRVGAPHDVYEQEADRVADQVMRMPEPHLQRQPLPEEEEEGLVQPKAYESSGVPVTEAPPVVNEVLRSPGRALDPGAREVLEPRFDSDFSQVRVHADTQAARSARSINARAYTVGHDVVFGQGQYRPGTEAGNRLLAHELAHVVQQGVQMEIGAVKTTVQNLLFRNQSQKGVL